MKSKFEITNCQCGKKHIADIDNIVVENGAINRLPGETRETRGRGRRGDGYLGSFHLIFSGKVLSIIDLSTKQGIKTKNNN